MKKVTLSAILLLYSITHSSTANADSYWVKPTPHGGYELYDLSSVDQTAEGFEIWSVEVDDHFPRVFGVVAYRQSQESFDCRTREYGIVSFKEHSANGRLLDDVSSPGDRGYRVVPDTDTAELYRAACAWRSGGAKLSPPGSIVQEPSVRAAYAYGRSLLHPSTK